MFSFEGLKASPVAWSSFIEAFFVIFYKKSLKNFSCICSIFGQFNPGFVSESGMNPYPDPESLEMVDPDPYPDSINHDPQHWCLHMIRIRKNSDFRIRIPTGWAN
jgi:hypothetical protein